MVNPALDTTEPCAAHGDAGCRRLIAGIGLGQLVASSIVSIYYNMILGWAIFYVFATLINATDLPWGSCSNDWNTLRQLHTCCKGVDLTALFLGT